MAGTYGYVGDVNNSIGMGSAYPGGRTFGATPPAANRFRVRNNAAGELGAVNQGDTMGAGTASAGMTSADMSMANNGSSLKWWIGLVILFILIVWAMKRFAPSEQREFGNINPGLYNGVFLTLYIVLILNVLKVFAMKVRIPGLSDLILAA